MNHQKDQSSTAALVQGVQQQDPASWDELYRRYRPLVLALAPRYGLSHAEAEDAVQETMVCVFRNITKFDRDPERGTFRAWLACIVRSRVIDILRRRTEWDPVETSISDPRTSTRERLNNQEWARHSMDRALEALRTDAEVNPRHLQIFLDRCVKGREVKEIAADHAVREELVYLVVHRIKSVLRAILNEQMKSARASARLGTGPTTSGTSSLLRKQPLFRHFYVRLISDPGPSLELLKLIRDFAKEQRQQASEWEELLALLYYGSIAAALVGYRHRITTMSNESLRKGLQYYSHQASLDAAARNLFARALGVLEETSP